MTSFFPLLSFIANNSYATRYVGVNSTLDWNGAKAHCRTVHTDLAFAITETDNDAMQKIASVLGISWIGGHRDTWKWSDGQNISNVLWLSGQPDNCYQHENCGVLDKGNFKDVKCTGLYYFICHINQPVIERQMVRLHVKSDSSIFDPDVQSAMLDLIKKTLDEKGMPMNINVTWKLHSNGQVFRKK
ncbi:C-type lectin 1 [Bagarius yarrelli]|uniref:C-type lectin 1 n=1 Tax=Bagarius yarrelli TaxID=175774 RepID=A0A556V438_BAGYA|nr:C-type lectin 1 [Bagarius yarrelli]